MVHVSPVVPSVAVLLICPPSLQFQLTVNFSALVTVFFGSVISGIQPLNVLQLLWWVQGVYQTVLQRKHGT
jgi:hypothetical protein